MAFQLVTLHSSIPLFYAMTFLTRHHVKGCTLIHVGPAHLDSGKPRWCCPVHQKHWAMLCPRTSRPKQSHKAQHVSLFEVAHLRSWKLAYLDSEKNRSCCPPRKHKATVRAASTKIQSQGFILSNLPLDAVLTRRWITVHLLPHTKLSLHANIFFDWFSFR